MNDLLQRASQGEFPHAPQQQKETCPCLPMSYKGKHCPNAVHGYEAAVLNRLQCSVTYHFLTHYQNGRLQWGVVVGYGTHTNACPVPRPSAAQVRQVAELSFQQSPAVSTAEIFRRVKDNFGDIASPEAVRRQRFNLRSEQNPYGRSFASLLQRYLLKIDNEQN